MANKDFDPPAHLADFGNPHRKGWSAWVSGAFERAIGETRSDMAGSSGKLQFYNPATTNPKGDTARQVIAWNAFPKDLLRCFGRDRAMREADRLWPLSAYDQTASYLLDAASRKATRSEPVFRPQSEYCEWRVDRDPVTKSIRRVTFTSEPPEYWMALYGTLYSADFPATLRQRMLKLYHRHVDQRVLLKELVVPKNWPYQVGPGFVGTYDYNPYNRWNTRDGIMHLCCPPNTLGLELNTAARGTVHYGQGSSDRALTYPDALNCGAGIGDPNRNSDPTIVAAVNALARLGAQVTLTDPVGVYMDRIDTNGWEMPDRLLPSQCWRIVRGAPGMISRLVVELPRRSQSTLSDMRIAGVPLEFGGQLAECVTVKLVAQAVFPKTSAARALAAAQPLNPARQDFAILRSNPSQIVEAPSDPKRHPFDVAFGAYR